MDKLRGNEAIVDLDRHVKDRHQAKLRIEGVVSRIDEYLNSDAVKLAKTLNVAASILNDMATKGDANYFLGEAQTISRVSLANDNRQNPVDKEMAQYRDQLDIQARKFEFGLPKQIPIEINLNNIENQSVNDDEHDQVHHRVMQIIADQTLMPVNFIIADQNDQSKEPIVVRYLPTTGD